MAEKTVKTAAKTAKKTASEGQKTVKKMQNRAEKGVKVDTKTAKTNTKTAKADTQTVPKTPPKTEKKNTKDAWKSAGGDIKNTLKILVAVCDSATASHSNIKSALKYCSDMKFADELRNFADKFAEFCCAARAAAEKYDREIEDKGRALQFLQRIGSDLKMITDPDTNSVAAKIILDTTRNMIEIGSLLRHTGNITQGAEELACDLLVFHETLINDMKCHL